MIDAISRYYETQNANIHRGVYQLSQIATDAYESARAKVAAFINAGDEKQVLFTRGTTEGINLVAGCWGRTFLKPGDEVIVSAMEHHSNIVPWQIACEMTGATLRVIPINDAGELLMDEYAKLLDPRTKFVSVTHVSNSLGTVNDVKTIAAHGPPAGALVMVDGAQWVAHDPTDVRDLGADFYAFSGHKLFGPTGIGVLYGRRELLEAMPPYQGGGDMIESVTFEKTDLRAAAQQVRGRHARHRRRGRPRGGDRLPQRDRLRVLRRPRGPPAPLRHGEAAASPRPAPHRHRRPTRAPSSRSCWKTRRSRRWTSAPDSTPRASPSAPATTAASR